MFIGSSTRRYSSPHAVLAAMARDGAASSRTHRRLCFEKALERRQSPAQGLRRTSRLFVFPRTTSVNTRHVEASTTFLVAAILLRCRPVRRCSSRLTRATPGPPPDPLVRKCHRRCRSRSWIPTSASPRAECRHHRRQQGDVIVDADPQAAQRQIILREGRSAAARVFVVARPFIPSTLSKSAFRGCRSSRARAQQQDIDEFGLALAAVRDAVGLTDQLLRRRIRRADIL